ncbi:MAG: CocE/NonD family hydrolase [Alphaproteobacteria bacterium]
MTATIRSDFPYAVRVIEDMWVAMPDGARLAARVWMPQGADTTPLPALLDYLPYRRRDNSRIRDDAMFGYLAGHGYVCVRLDIRGTGDSDGLFDDEYSPQELQDGVDAVAWIAAQPWCSGRVGMLGISWGGFNSLQIAALRPPALKAIITCCSTDDRYADDIHYMGGSLLIDNFSWAATMFARLTVAPDPAIVGDGWRRMWLERLENHRPPLNTWLAHQRRDDFWRHGSVGEDHGAIQCPVMALGGWADSYTNAIPRLMAGLTVPRQAIIGAWSHKWGFDGGPGPTVGMLQEMLRWWDHWLKDVDTGITDEPMLRAWMQESVPPAAGYALRPGRWIAEPVWPPADGITVRELALNHDGMAESRGQTVPLDVASPQDTGQACGEWCAHDTGTDLPTDQRLDDAFSLTFDSEPLEETIEMLGAPVVTLELASDRPVALVAVRLNDVRPDGTVARISFGILNLTHRHGHDRVVPMVPGERTSVRVQLNDIGQQVPKGHRLRVAISTAYWPMVWPSPEPVRLTVFAGASAVHLPLRAPRPEDARISFRPPETAPPARTTVLEPSTETQTVTRDVASGELRSLITFNQGLVRLEDTGNALGAWRSEDMRICPDDPLSARGEINYDFSLGKGDWQTRVHTRSRIASDHTHFILSNDIEAYEGDTRIFARTFDTRIPRDGN